jgi:hypothetical protein
MVRKGSLKYITTSLSRAHGREDVQSRIFHIAYKCNRVFRISKNIIKRYNSLLFTNLMLSEINQLATLNF